MFTLNTLASDQSCFSLVALWLLAPPPPSVAAAPSISAAAAAAPSPLLLFFLSTPVRPPIPDGPVHAPLRPPLHLRRDPPDEHLHSGVDARKTLSAATDARGHDADKDELI